MPPRQRRDVDLTQFSNFVNLAMAFVRTVQNILFVKLFHYVSLQRSGTLGKIRYAYVRAFDKAHNGIIVGMAMASSRDTCVR